MNRIPSLRRSLENEFGLNPAVTLTSVHWKLVGGSDLRRGLSDLRTVNQRDDPSYWAPNSSAANFPNEEKDGYTIERSDQRWSVVKGYMERRNPIVIQRC